MIDHGIADRDITIEDITLAVKEMPDGKTFLRYEKDSGLKPNFAKKIDAIYLIMHWPYVKGHDEGNEYEVSKAGITLYAAVMEHGKKHVAELFFANEESGEMLGTHKVFSINFPNRTYNDHYDEWLMEELAGKTLGVKREKTLGHNLF
jgi:hypothetical protein